MEFRRFPQVGRRFFNGLALCRRSGFGVRWELHQVKRSQSKGKWTLPALASDGLLQAIGRALAGNDDRFVFVSGSEARELAELCEAARDAKSAEEFERAFLAAEGEEAVIREAA